MRPITHRPVAGSCLAVLLTSLAVTQSGTLHAAPNAGPFAVSNASSTLSSAAPAAGQPAARATSRRITPNDGGGKSIAPSFMERPGIVEFSGQLIARPLQTLTPSDRARIDAAVAASGTVLKYYPEVDEYVIDVTPPAPASGSVTHGPAENARAGELMRTGLFEYVHPNWICYPP
jgi:hypothetical protein